MKNYSCKEGLYQNQCACASPVPRIVQAAIAGHQDEEAGHEIEEGNPEPYFQEPGLCDWLIHWELVEKQQRGDALVVGADGRTSVVRDCSGLAVEDFGAPMDVFWMRLSKRSDDPYLSVLADHGKLLAMLDRGDYWQCGFPILKGSAEEVQRRGIEDFRAGIVEVAPFLRDRVMELRNWNDVRLLTVRVNRLRQWYRPGLVCIGDAAHAMSPVAGIGVNLAIQDAVAAANILAEPLRNDTVSTVHLAKIQRRRAFPTRVSQRLQELIRKETGRDVGKSGTARPPLPVRLLERTTLLCRLRTRFVGVGIRPEHVKTPDISGAQIQHT